VPHAPRPGHGPACAVKRPRCREAERIRDPEDPPIAPPGRQSSDHPRPAPVVECGPRREAEPADGPPRIGPYRVLGVLGRGGTSRVLLATRDDLELGRRVAIKVAERSCSGEVRERFRLERQILADLEHPGIARLYGGGSTEAGRPYLVMEYVEGSPLDVHGDTLSLVERIRLMIRVSDAVTYAHRHLVVHLDLGPPNILVDGDGAPKLLDFGIARCLEEEAAITRDPHRRPRTPAHASPEQLRGERLTTSSDIFSLGLLLYRLLAGRSPEPHPGTGDSELLPPSRVEGGRFGRRLIGDLDAIVQKALELRPEDRYTTVEQFAADLRRHLDGRPILARPATLGYRAARFFRRHWLVTALAATLVGTVVSAAGTLAWQTYQLAAKRDRAEAARLEAEGVARFFGALLGGAEAPSPDSSPAASKRQAETVPDLLDRGNLALGRFSAPAAVRARLLHTLGGSYHHWGQPERAGRLLEQALELRRRSFEPGDPRIAETLDSLGRVARAQADFPRSLQLHRRALDLLRRSVGEDDPRTAGAYVALGNTLYDLLEVRGALAMYRRGCAIRKRVSGPDHPLTASCSSHLAKASADLGRFDDAIRFAGEAVAASERRWPGGHPSTATSLNILAQAFLESRRPAEAEPVLRRALELRRRFLHEGHPLRIESLNNLALSLGHQGKLAEAELLLRRCLDMGLELHGELHHDTFKAKYNLAKALFVQGKLAEAEPLLRQSLSIGRRLQPEGGGLAYPLAGLAQLLLADGRPREALPFAEEAHRRAIEALGPEHRLSRLSQGMIRDCRRRGEPPGPGGGAG
ncbi:MAG: serine/threonine-protein kinase, partial [Holophagales bacterium]|nr:serine/threonine-protein kinase [Holophagales bacterium]